MTAILRKNRRSLDSFDRAILRIIQRDNKTPQRVIGDKVNLSAAAVQRRIAAMEAEGVIARNVAIIDPDALGLAITTVVEVQLLDERAATADAAKALFKDAPEVQHCYYMTGGVSFVLVIVCGDMRDYEALTRRLGHSAILRTHRHRGARRWRPREHPANASRRCEARHRQRDGPACR